MQVPVSSTPFSGLLIILVPQFLPDLGNAIGTQISIVQSICRNESKKEGLGAVSVVSYKSLLCT